MAGAREDLRRTHTDARRPEVPGDAQPPDHHEVWTGPVLDDGEFHQGWFDPHSGELARGSPPGRAQRGLIVPPLRNCHTHLGDTLARAEFPSDLALAEVVGPEGWKARWLARHDARASIAAGLDEAARCGTGMVLDFREGGADGLAALASTASPGGRAAGARAGPRLPQVVGLGRAEPGAPLPGAHAGLSSYHDLASGEPERLAAEARRRGGLVALHHAEGEAEPLAPVLALKPDFLVHLCHAPHGDLERLRDAGVAVVVCPRANHRFGLRPPLEAMLEVGLDVGLGTDNGMLASVDLLAELRYCRRAFPAVAPRELMRMAVGALEKVLNKVQDCRPGQEKRVLFSQHHSDPWKSLFHPRTRLLATSE